jgi:hypothetical protein
MKKDIKYFIKSQSFLFKDKPRKKKKEIKKNITNFYNDLKNIGVWDKLDSLYIFNHEKEKYLINLRRP